MNNYVFMFIGFLIGFLFSAIVSWLLMRKEMDNFEEKVLDHLLSMAKNGDRVIELAKGFEQRDEVYMETSKKLCDICERQLDANKEYGRRVQELVSNDHERNTQLVLKCITMVETVVHDNQERGELADERWEMIKDYILEQPKESAHIDFSNLLKDIDPKEVVRIDKKDLVNLLDRSCMHCKHVNEDPMEEPCFSCVITEAGTSFTNFEPGYEF